MDKPANENTGNSADPNVNRSAERAQREIDQAREAAEHASAGSRDEGAKESPALADQIESGSQAASTRNQ